MHRTHRFALALSLLAPLLAIGGTARAGEPAVKISCSPVDPNATTADLPEDETLSFYVFTDGVDTMGGEFGLKVDGAEFVRFELPNSFWMSMPSPVGAPGTIAQVHVGDCPEGPNFWGTLIVRPKTPGDRVVVDVIASTRANYALLLDCANAPIDGFRAFPAVANSGGKREMPHWVEGEKTASGEPEDPAIPKGEPSRGGH
ncbi:MAG: hypothetical protein R3B81_10070 [bacterium]